MPWHRENRRRNHMSPSIKTVKGGTRLVFDSVVGITNVVEGMHASIARGMISASVYSIIRGVTGALREGVDTSLNLAPSSDHRSAAETRTVAALNGAFGDHLETTGNTLALSMSLFSGDSPLDLNPAALAASLPQASGHLVVMVHGLSLSELSWRRQDAPDIGSQLQEELGCTPLYLRYNSGRHISSNGQQLAALLDQLCEAWPVPVESLSLIGHSMGGLVIRSACWYADQAHNIWLQHLQRVVCLGTPHHGSPLEKAGHALDLAMQSIPYTAPLALGRQRSAGIKDLRHGNLRDEDWQDYHPDQPGSDTRQAVPLLPNVDYYFAAASVGRDRQDPLGQLLGDLLVRLDSAVGSHQDDARRINIKPENCRVFHEKNHFDLLDDERVHRQIIDWFQPCFQGQEKAP
jgi:pimeloyl-ACP methyl ester carboxylesterase